MTGLLRPAALPARAAVRGWRRPAQKRARRHPLGSGSKARQGPWPCLSSARGAPWLELAQCKRAPWLELALGDSVAPSPKLAQGVEAGPWQEPALRAAHW